MNISSGQIIEARAARMKFLKHFGVIIVHQDHVFILHNTPGKGSSIISYEDWVNTRTDSIIYDSELCELTNDEILTRFGVDCRLKYNLLGYNCEHFIDCMMDQPQSSEQLRKGIGLMGLILLMFR